MDFPQTLTTGRLLKRYKRFLADVRLDDGSVITAHCPNPGSMLSLIDGSEQTVWLSHSKDPKRKLPSAIELLSVGDTLVGINTQRPNRVAEAAIIDGRVAELKGYANIHREVRYGDGSRIDLLLKDDGKPDCYVEVKSVTLSRARGLIEFPDSVTKRGTKHLHELAKVAQSGHRAVLFLLSPRADGEIFRPASDIDPAWAAALNTARDAGVDVICYTCTVKPQGIYAAHSIPVELD